MTELKTPLNQSISRALEALMARRNREGFWEGRLASSPLATAVAVCALADEQIPAHILDQAADYLASTQNQDGGWGDTEISKSNLAATLLVLSAEASLRGHNKTGAASKINAQRGKAYADSLGGLEAGLSKVYGKDLTFQTPIRMTAAHAGLLPWTQVDQLPFELALAPRSMMSSLGIPVVSYAIPALVSVGLARHKKAPTWMLPWGILRNAITESALAAILKMQPSSGGYLEAIPITAFCLIALKAAGRADHAVAQNAKKFLLESRRTNGAWPVEVNLSIWNTTRAIDTLAAGGLLNKALTPNEQALTRDWLLNQQTKAQSPYSDAKPGGWGWNHLPGSVPDVDDTSGAILSLKILGVADEDPSIVQGRKWLLSLQNDNGGWPTFCKGWEKLPFDRSAPDLTAHALRAIGLGPHSGSGYLPINDARTHQAMTVGKDYLVNVQHKDGSFAPLWFGCESAPDEINRTYGTAHVLISSEDIVLPYSFFRQASFRYLRGIQNQDGGFGGTAGAPSTVEETGLALRASAVKFVDSPAEGETCTRAADWLLKNQRPDGTWKPAPIGFYFAVLWYYEELYPLMYALGGLSVLDKISSTASTKAVPGRSLLTLK